MGLLTYCINVTLDGCGDHQEGIADDETHAFFTDAARLGRPVDGLSALGYDAMGVLAAAIQAADSTERDAIRDALAATRDFPGVTGHITMNVRRDPIKPAVIVRVTPQGFTYEATVAPR